MGKIVLRQKEISKIQLHPTTAGNRAVFMVEAESRQERRQVKQLFDTVSELAEVVQLSDGQLMSFAVRIRGDASLCSKIEWLLKSQFSFSVVERAFSEITYRLIESLCEDSGSRMVRISRCNICDTADPFPTRVTMRDVNDDPVLEATYCGPCAAAQADGDRKKMLVALLAADRRNFAAIRQARLVRARQRPVSRGATSAEDVQTYAIAS